MRRPRGGLYVHVPYCRRRCPYCDFNVWIDKNAPFALLLRACDADLVARASLISGPLESVYFGGGTPSLAPGVFFEAILGRARSLIGIAPDAEITVEVEPGTIAPGYLDALAEAGVNRLSVGWQSTHDRLLRTLGRGHDSKLAGQLLREAMESGHFSVNADLIFAVPGQSIADLDRDLDELLRLGPEHVSLYALTYEKGTEFTRRREQGRLEAASEELEVTMMKCIAQRLRSAGFEHYEVSNFAKPGHRAVHNSAYWRGAPYLGIGPGAHGLSIDTTGKAWRYESWKNPGQYISYWNQGGESVLRGGVDCEWSEHLGPADLTRERLMTGMRLENGLDIAVLDFGARQDEIEAAASRAEDFGWLERDGSRWRPTELGRLHADALAELFF